MALGDERGLSCLSFECWLFLSGSREHSLAMSSSSQTFSNVSRSISTLDYFSGHNQPDLRR